MSARGSGRWAPVLVLACMIAATCSAGCADWPPTRPMDNRGSGAAGSGVGSGAPSETWSLALPADGTPNPDGTVTAPVVDAQGQTLGQIDFFTAIGAPVDDGSGTTYLPDALIAVSGTENATDPNAVLASNEMDFPADQIQPGATMTAQAGGLVFTVVIESADVQLINGLPMLDAASLVVRVDVALIS